ncbi:DNA adenine methylase [Roseospirillum parvum]|uniref:site-specific DNA-methyltransferase (adenine-specific) n=1 Tax=Roseospirillum parvum TaxID=83401 RepID=A0A1G8G0F5_9PROT|nr:DNA adenine methylase [Roseospirillum parvum]SDH87841.1 DNA adenine methylase [Roseospirillum parvum]
MESTRSVTPTTPVAPYVGGKRALAARIIERIEAIPHATYAEPFVGMGGVFLRRRTAAKVEVINDGSRDVATFFRVLQRHYPQFMDTLRFQITARSEFERLKAADPDTLTDLERSARFLYLQRLSYGGKVASRTFGVEATRPARFNLNALGPRLEELHERLAGVVIECLPFAAFLDRYDRPETLFYVDPPYWGTEAYYGRELFSRADHTRLAAALKQLGGGFILSMNDVPEVRELYAWADIEEVQTTYSVRGRGHNHPAAELLISG